MRLQIANKDSSSVEYLLMWIMYLQKSTCIHVFSFSSILSFFYLFLGCSDMDTPRHLSPQPIFEQNQEEKETGAPGWQTDPGPGGDGDAALGAAPRQLRVHHRAVPARAAHAPRGRALPRGRGLGEAVSLPGAGRGAGEGAALPPHPHPRPRPLQIAGGTCQQCRPVHAMILGNIYVHTRKKCSKCNAIVQKIFYFYFILFLLYIIKIYGTNNGFVKLKFVAIKTGWVYLDSIPG